MKFSKAFIKKKLGMILTKQTYKLIVGTRDGNLAGKTWISIIDVLKIQKSINRNMFFFFFC